MRSADCIGRSTVALPRLSLAARPPLSFISLFAIGWARWQQRRLHMPARSRGNLQKVPTCIGEIPHWRSKTIQKNAGDAQYGLCCSCFACGPCLRAIHDRVAATPCQLQFRKSVAHCCSIVCGTCICPLAISNHRSGLKKVHVRSR